MSQQETQSNTAAHVTSVVCSDTVRSGRERPNSQTALFARFGGTSSLHIVDDPKFHRLHDITTPVF